MIMTVTVETKEPHGLIASGRVCYILSKMNNRLPPSRAVSLRVSYKLERTGVYAQSDES